MVNNFLHYFSPLLILLSHTHYYIFIRQILPLALATNLANEAFYYLFSFEV